MTMRGCSKCRQPQPTNCGYCGAAIRDASTILAEAGNLITVRPVGEVEGEDAPARVARAERRLDRGDLAGAVAEVAALQGGAAEVLAPWKAEAEARLAAEAAVDLLDGEVSARFAEAN